MRISAWAVAAIRAVMAQDAGSIPDNLRRILPAVHDLNPLELNRPVRHKRKAFPLYASDVKLTVLDAQGVQSFQIEVAMRGTELAAPPALRIADGNASTLRIVFF
jgi:hypothetical protein